MSKVLPGVKYFCQWENVDVPGGSCNVTSVAMSLTKFGLVGDGSCRFPDQLNRECEAKGWDRHSPYDLQKLVQAHGLHDDYTDNGSLADIRQAIDENKVCVVHLSITRSGHVILIKGYDGNNFIVNDSAGEWHRSGYNDFANGEGLKYSDRLILCTGITETYNQAMELYDSGIAANKITPQSGIWLHRIWK